MSDQQLLETAALIAGIAGTYDVRDFHDQFTGWEKVAAIWDDEDGGMWNPLENADQALVMLQYITPSSDDCNCHWSENYFYRIPVGLSVVEMCRAIVVTAVAEYQAAQDFEAHKTEAAYICEESGHQWIEQAREKYIDRTCRRCLFSERIVPDGVTL